MSINKHMANVMKHYASHFVTLYRGRWLAFEREVMLIVLFTLHDSWEADNGLHLSASRMIGRRGERTMKFDAEIVQRWLDAYHHAWSTYDAVEIGALFTDDAEYRWRPWDEGDAVARGRAHIVAAWLENRDAAGTYRGAYCPLLVQDNVAIAVGMSFYYTNATQGTLGRAYHNLWVLRFTNEGQCRSFTEWFMQAPSTP